MRFSRHLMTAAALVCGSTALAQLPVQAQIEVPFEGGVLASCEGIGGNASIATAGQLRPSGLGLSSIPDDSSSDAQSATIDRINCNTTAQLQLDEIVGVETNGVPLADFDCVVEVQADGAFFGGSSNLESCTTLQHDFGTVDPGPVDDIALDLSLEYNGVNPLPSGNYEFTVKLNLVP